MTNRLRSNKGRLADTNQSSDKNFINMKKNIVIGIIIVLVIIVVIYFLFIREGVLNISNLQKDEAKLADLEKDIESFNQDEILSTEFDQTFDDILGEDGVIDASAALDESSIIQEVNQIDLTQLLNALAADNAALQEFNRISNDISQ